MAVLLARQTTQLSLPESKEDNAARGAATVLKTDVYPSTLMQSCHQLKGKKHCPGILARAS